MAYFANNAHVNNRYCMISKTRLNKKTAFLKLNKAGNNCEMLFGVLVLIDKALKELLHSQTH